MPLHRAVAHVPAGSAFTFRQSENIRRAVATAGAETGLRFFVYVGQIEGDVRSYARRRHAALGSAAEYGVLIVVDPDARLVEIVTGQTACRRLDDRAAGLASLSMATSFAGGDLTGGIVNGLRMMAQAAARPPVLHEHDDN
jgi:uncharacterized membrane protein YgcG